MKASAPILLLLVALLAYGNAKTMGQSEREPGGAGLNVRSGRSLSVHQPMEFGQASRRTSPEVWTLGVRRRVPEEYGTIGAAINACNDGDTVLVSEGTYLENIRYRGKAIIVASLYLIDGDTAHIAATIIDGSNPSHPDSGSAVSLIDGEDTTSVLCGLTIRGGTGTYGYWGSSGWARGGGGVYCVGGGATIIMNSIKRNRVVDGSAFGGGIAAEGGGASSLILEGNRITDNFVQGDSVWGYGGGADIFGTSARVVGNVFERDTVIGASFAVGGGMALYGSAAPFPEAYVQGNIFRANDLRAAARGAVGGGMLIGSTGPVTITENLIEENVARSVSHAWAQGGGICVDDGNATGSGRKVIERNRIAGNRLTRGGGSDICGGGVFLYYTVATLDANDISGNSVNGGGGGLATYRSSFQVRNNLMRGNSSTGSSGGGIYVMNAPVSGADQVIINNTITDNRAAYNGGGILVRDGAAVIGFNNIFWGDTANTGREAYVISATLFLDYCDIGGGYAGTGNININPQFAPGQFTLSDGSPCIGAGRDSLYIGGRWHSAPGYCFHGGIRPNPAGSSPDLGACENPLGTPVDVEEGPTAERPEVSSLSQNHPNPFNPSTTIRYELPKASHVSLSVYDVLGREVTTLLNEEKGVGAYTVQWDASGMSSGVYFYRLRAGDFVQTKRMMVLK